jgi:WD40-like Beta Propeller Repeat
MGMTADPARDLVRERARRGSPCSQCGVEPGDARARAACRRIAARGCGEDPLCRLVAGWDRAGGRARARGVSAGGVPYRESGLRDQGLIDPRSGFAARRFTYLRRTDGSPAVRLGEGQALALSPDGKWALAWRTSSSQLVLLPTGVGEAQTLSVPAMTSVAWGTWFPDSRRVLFAAETNGRFRIYVRELGGGETRPIGPPEFTLPSSLGAAEAATGVSPDGRTLVAAGHDGVVLLAVESGQLRQCPGGERGDQPVRWSADGRSLFVLRYKGFAAQVYRLELTTGRRTLLRELAPPDPAGAGFPDVRVTPDGKSYACSFIRNLNDLYLVDRLK